MMYVAHEHLFYPLNTPKKAKLWGWCLASAWKINVCSVHLVVCLWLPENNKQWLFWILNWSTQPWITKNILCFLLGNWWLHRHFWWRKPISQKKTQWNTKPPKNIFQTKTKCYYNLNCVIFFGGGVVYGFGSQFNLLLLPQLFREGPQATRWLQQVG